jgi:hypothetical protein
VVRVSELPEKDISNVAVKCGYIILQLKAASFVSELFEKYLNRGDAV